MLTSDERTKVTRDTRDLALRVVQEPVTFVLKAKRGAALSTEVVQFYTQMNTAEMIAGLCDEILRLRRSLQLIAETCVEDPDAAQFAHRVLDGTAEPPPENL